MAVAERRATSVWEGNLISGKGRVEVGSGALPEFSVTWAARTEKSDGKTSPEELIAAAEASCFSMALASDLTKAGHEPQSLTVTANCILDRVDGKPTITTLELTVSGRVDGMDDAAFKAAADDTSQNCPVSRALKSGVEIRIVSATLES